MHHRLFRADTFQNRISANTLRQLLDLRHTLVAALGDDVGRAVFECEVLPRLVAAHGDDPTGFPLICGEHAHKANRTVTDNDHS